MAQTEADTQPEATEGKLCFRNESMVNKTQHMLKDLPELLKAGIISEETAQRIQDYYRTKSESSTNRLFMVFGILGAILVGLGIILIIAHNWDELSRAIKTVFAFLPLLIGQGLCGYVLIKKSSNTTWRESAAAFLFCAVGASISLVSQIYHIPGDLSAFLLTWMLLCFPLIYVMRSSMASLLYLIGITCYACETSYWSYSASESYIYWGLLLLVLPHYYLLYKQSPKSNFIILHHWLIPLSVVVTLGTVAKDTEELMFIAYISLFGLFYQIGSLDYFTQQKVGNSGYKAFGSFGTLVLLMTLSFDWFWEDLRNQAFQLSEVVASPEFLAAAIISLLATLLLNRRQGSKPLKQLRLLEVTYIVFIIIFIMGLYWSLAVILINIYVFAMGILTIREGAKHDHLGVLNYGLLIITVLVVCRFFDTDLSFVIRGVLFVLVGIGFFVTNYAMLKKRRARE